MGILGERGITAAEGESVAIHATYIIDAQIVEQRGPMVPIVVVGNKSELADRAVSRELAETVAVYDWECGYVECSAKENQNIIQVFKELLVQAKTRSLKELRNGFHDDCMGEVEDLVLMVVPIHVSFANRSQWEPRAKLQECTISINPTDSL
ncbi:hypothetical protein J6590_043380 [Homalodisca vitripennis]|nr:hypothetical protein J6590_043380 [Homalodisca vitripennis]